MKFIAFNVREDEEKYFAQWEKETGNEVLRLPDMLDMSSVEKIEGFDGVLALQTGTYPDEMFTEFKKFGVKVFSIRNVGVDNINLDAAKKNGVVVTNVPAYSPNAIAEFSVTQLMQLLRNTTIFRNKVAKQDFRWAPYVGKELRSLTVGVVGTGRIGRAAIDIYRGFGAKVIAYDLYPNPELKKQGIYVDSYDELFSQADVITLHMPATPDDYHLIGTENLNKMKDGSYIINTARGALVDTKALITALRSGKLAGAALDTYENESDIFNHDLSNQEIKDETFKELLSLDNVLVTPHVAFYTETAVKNMVLIALNSAKSVCEDGTASTVVK
ncbi:D-2-hydroxyacid dehydrogenase [Liquorilactobacillus mali]|uniref:D-lactate dehydrogenase n=1 Tax=Liquorilactobacillus mali KCTC 3596 = DSM 20444 TaxID=1046596 RepID=J1F249_9LACO|nr:D-2-hydroxyacid dehydrogenase [Liquorilactobacillus mali]EJE98707.1 D-lactate dehydrogenase [Liquorilactobacillus mali KCTC 3596 = DSM 20444]KRN10941.1 D-lactate dehydrogenase [Liquorilactobacillus mali KCTC 3596 = DSM 20444]MDC7952089.1 D-2-hydroxyacid dehydrogenase [Liquorilactobacillus mali]QFQ74820.1 D-2-hydroxyacid dehydrogenase [Liquorilactobacillus mali]